MKIGRPRKYDINDVIEKFEEYIKKEEEPLVQEFALNYGISRPRLYELAEENKELSDTIKKAIEKQEVFLLKGATRGQLNPTFCIFRLKQPCFGYNDKQEIEHNGKLKTESKVDLSGLSIEELKKLESIASKSIT